VHRRPIVLAGVHRGLPAAAASGWDHERVDQDDPEKRIAELENQLAENITLSTQHQAAGPKPGWYADPDGAALLRYWDGRKWTAATDEPAQTPADVVTATPANQPESSAGPQWSAPPGEGDANPALPPPQGYPSYPGQPAPYSAAGEGVDPEAPYGRDPRTKRPLSDKRALVAGALELLFGLFGAGRFYIGSTAIGVSQLGLFILALVLASVVPDSAGTGSMLVGLLIFALLIWEFIDAIWMFTGFGTDGQGRKLR
jgi:TM2 domain-containing membrane protein YozV